jgi:hypothetical protein
MHIHQVRRLFSSILTIVAIVASVLPVGSTRAIVRAQNGAGAPQAQGETPQQPLSPELSLQTGVTSTTVSSPGVAEADSASSEASNAQELGPNLPEEILAMQEGRAKLDEPVTLPVEVPNLQNENTQQPPQNTELSYIPKFSVALDVKTHKPRLGKSAQVVLNAQAFTQTRKLDIVITLPAGVEPSGNGKQPPFDPATRQLSWKGIVVEPSSGKPGNGRKGGYQDTFKLDISAVSVPVNFELPISAIDTLTGERLETAATIAVVEERGSQRLERGKGGSVQATDRVTLDFPADALKFDTPIESVVFAPVTGKDNNGKRDVNLRFELGPDMEFAKPITARVSIGDLFTPEMVAQGSRPALYHVAREVVTPVLDGPDGPITYTKINLIEQPASFDEKSGILEASLSHFTDYQIGLQKPVDPSAWRLKANAPTVGLFRGSVNYGIPIAVPGMVDGLQPNLSLSYSSAAADGGGNQKFTPGTWLSLGNGWSLPMSRITRATSASWVCFNPPGIDWQGQCGGAYAYNQDYRNEFTLELGGQSFQLKQKNGNGNGGEYVPKEYAPIKVLRCTSLYTSANNALCNVTNTNQSGEYWQVWTPDGTRYVFGIDATTEVIRPMSHITDWTAKVTTAYHPTTHAWSGYAGAIAGSIPHVWHLRHVYAPNRDALNSRWSVQYDYAVGTQRYIAPFWGCPNTCFNPWEDQEWARPSRILYGPSIRTDGSAATQRWGVWFGYNAAGDNSRLANISIGVADAAGNAVANKWLRQYAFTVTDVGADSYLTSVSENGFNGSGWQGGLPVTTMGYTDYSHASGTRKLLTYVANGYGAEWTYQYQGNVTWNSYWVTTATIKSGSGYAGATTDVRVYEYSDAPTQRCVRTNSTDPNWNGVGACVDAAEIYWSDSWPNNYAGFEFVNEKAVNPANVNDVYGMTSHRFHARNLQLNGREHETRVYAFDTNGAYDVRSSTKTGWAAVTSGNDGTAWSYPAGVYAVQVAATKSFPYGNFTTDSNGFALCDADKGCVWNETYYDRYGNTIRQVNRGFEGISGDESTTITGYVPNETAWIVSKPRFVNLYNGAYQSGWPANSEFRTEVQLTYDSNTSYTQAPTKGQLKKVTRGSTIATSYPLSILLVDTSAGYDAVGNITSVTDGRGNTSYATYETNGWFLTEMRNALNHYSKFVYYCVNELSGACTAGQPYGLVKAVRDPNSTWSTCDSAGNGCIQTIYEYDRYGRLKKIAKPGDTLTNPSEAFSYYDGIDGGGSKLTNWPNTPLLIDHWIYSAPNVAAVWKREFYDGLGRVVQTHTPRVGGDIVTWVAYDAFGAAREASVPYEKPAYVYGTGAGGSTNSPYVTPDTGKPKTVTQQNWLGRQLWTMGPDGAQTKYYYGIDNSPYATPSQMNYVKTNLGVHSMKDAKGHSKHQVLDGNGRTTRVREFRGSCYITDSGCTDFWRLDASSGGAFGETKYTY